MPASCCWTNYGPKLLPRKYGPPFSSSTFLSWSKTFLEKQTTIRFPKKNLGNVVVKSHGGAYKKMMPAHGVYEQL